MKKVMALFLIVSLAVGCLCVADAEEYFTVEEWDVPYTGQTFVIYGWNDEFQTMLGEYYIKAIGGIDNKDGTFILPNGDMIEFIKTPNENGEYQMNLDRALMNRVHIDMFLLEADYALKYVDSDYTKPLSSIGIADEALFANQYEYTIDVARDESGVIKASSWQATPGLFLYRRSLAEKYLGVTTPEEMQEKVKDWDAFLETAREVNRISEGQTKLIPSVGDVWQVVRDVRTSPWVDEALQLNIDDQVAWYFGLAKTLREENLTAEAVPWSNAWNAGIGNDSIMGYFFSTWGIQFTMLDNCGGTKPGEGTYGDWAAVDGPQPYYWGGTWLAVANTCKNNALAKDIIEYFTVDTDSMQDYCRRSYDYVNNITAIQNIIDAGFSFDFLGGQDHYSLFQAVTPLIDTSAMSPYDQNINIALDAQVNAYANGDVDYETAIQQFKDNVTDLYPEIMAD